MNDKISRRRMLACSGACLASGAASAAAPAAKPVSGSREEPFRYCLNTATIRGQKLAADEEIDVAARAGYQGIEPWIGNLKRYVERGGSIEDLKKRLADRGLIVESAIGFAQWIVDDDAQRAKGLEQMRTDMDAVARIGGKRIAAPPAGAHGTPGMDLGKIAERYRAVLELGRKMGVVPQLEIWGSSKTLSRLGEAAFVAVDSDHPDACLLLDVYHLYKGGFDFKTLRLLNGAAMHVWHVNDYPADPPRETIGDGDRVYPGDGVAPLGSIFRDLYSSGFRGALSLELFNRDYWKQEPLVVAKTGLEKTRKAVRAAFAK